MNYAERLRTIQAMDNDTALEAIKNEAANARTDETRVKFFSGALAAEVTTRYGEKSMGMAANALGIEPSTAYQRAQVVTFYNGYEHCEALIEYLPLMGFTHFREAMRLGKWHEETHGVNAYSVAVEALERAQGNEWSTRELKSYVKAQISGEPETVGTTWKSTDIKDEDDLGHIYHSIRIAFNAGALVSVSIKELKRHPEAAD